MLTRGLTSHDLNVLEKIKDPESAPSTLVLIDSTLPRDPHITNKAEYDRIAISERHVIMELQSIEGRMTAHDLNDHEVQARILKEYDACTKKLNNLIISYPSYASAHNNHAQALRRRYGESVLLRTPSPLPVLIPAYSSHDEDITEAATIILHNLDTAISLLSPLTPFTSISPQAAKTLSQAHTQRGALYHITAKHMNANSEARLRIDEDWTVEDLEELASRDFMMGGRYGNEIARGLAVATNPTAKLCGSIVREAMRKEFEGLVA
jgi:hypothetical protein